MSYAGYVIASYAVFVIVLGSDVLSTHLQVRRQLRDARRRQSRDAARARPKRSVEVQ